MLTRPDNTRQDIRLDDCYAKLEGRVYMRGLQALARIPMAQIRRDRQAGLNTAAFISGYRGSPLATLDQTLAAAAPYLQEYDIEFRPAVNEDLAATMVWGSQQLHLSPGAKRDGVVSMWYGKGPGVDRCGDVFKHANAAGSAKHGGVLCLAGDDHGAKSSTVPHQSDHAFMSALIPMLYPSSIYEFIPYGLLGIAMSRYSGCWVGMKLLSDTVESAAAVDLTDEMRPFTIPDDFTLPEDGVNLRWPDDRHAQDERLQNYKGFAAIAFARANHVNYVAIDSPDARFGIVSSGKAYEDVRQALRELGLNAEIAADLGVRVYKVGMPWPLEPHGIRHFCEGLHEVLVVEERREIIENQIKQQLFNWRADVRPRIIGKADEYDKPLLPLSRELDVASLAQLIGERLLSYEMPEDKRGLVQKNLQKITAIRENLQGYTPNIVRTPYFCSGCPHNSSTKIPEEARALGGIGCHFMVQWMDRNTDTYSQMGGEGVAWAGTAPFTDEPHIFSNLGDGTYYHSGILAIRQAIASGQNITYKILYNDAVAMTGGQAVDGTLSIPQMVQQLKAEGLRKIVLVSDNPQNFNRRGGDRIPKDIAIYHRDAIHKVMQDLRATEGCTAMIYHQTCAAEKRRRRKRGLYPQAKERVYIHPQICENCGDCSVQSNCVSVEPLETKLGRKRQINQGSCNMDYACVSGFCPSFISLVGAEMKGGSVNKQADFSVLPEPPQLTLPPVVNVAISGVGGTGVLTVGNILGMASHLQGKAFMALDVSGLAQKGGAVLSHVRIGETPDKVATAKIATAGADVLLSADNVVSHGRDVRALCHKERTYGILSDHLTPVSDFVRNKDFDFQADKTARLIQGTLKPDPFICDFQNWAQKLLGDSLYGNMMMLGAAVQKGVLGIDSEYVMQAIAINGVAVENNKMAFQWGRLLVHDLPFCRSFIGIEASSQKPQKPQDMVAERAQDLRDYHNRAYGDRYMQEMEKLQAMVAKRLSSAKKAEQFYGTVGKNYYKLLAFKDEFEVARQLSSEQLRHELAGQFAGNYRLVFNLSPPLLAGRDKNTDRPKKYRIGGWILPLFRALSACKFLRFTPLNIFGWSEERRWEVGLSKNYLRTVHEVMEKLHDGNVDAALEIVNYPDAIRGFGFIKRNNWEKLQGELSARLQKYHSGDGDKHSLAA